MRGIDASMLEYRKINKVILNKYETPFYCFDVDLFEENIRKYKSILPEDVLLCFSLKSNPWFVNAANKFVDLIEVCSMGELQLCLNSGINPEKISFGGISKTKEECVQLVKLPLYRVSIESKKQMLLLNEEARNNDVIMNVVLRLTSGNQFGMSKEQVKEVLNEAHKYTNIKIKGIHYYAGTQKMSINEACKISTDLADVILFENIEEIQFGAGIGVPLFGDKKREACKEYEQSIMTTINELSKHKKVIYECGRCLTFNTGIYVTKVLETKENNQRKFVIVDGGIHHLSYNGQFGGVPIPNIELIFKNEKKELCKQTICGSLCTVSDILAKDIMLNSLDEGDLLVFMNVGAYSVTEARSMFLSRDLPMIILCEKNVDIIARKRINTYKLNYMEVPL